MLVVIGVPIAFTVIMDAMEALFERGSGWQRRVMKVAWDLCVLTLGLVAGLFADREILTTLNSRGLYHPVGLLLGSIIVSFGVAVALAFLRRGVDPVPGWKALLALVLGACTLGLPVYLAALR